MTPGNKTRLNLYLSKDVVDFAKKWSYVTNISISKMLENFLKQQRDRVATTTPFQWVSDQNFATPLSEDDKELQDLEEYLNNPDEEIFCTQNSSHPRARMRQKLTSDYEKLFREKQVKQKRLEKELIQRWMEIFTL